MRARRLLLLAFVGTVIGAHTALAQVLTFARDDYASYPGARAIVSADFDRDGRPDLAQANTGRNSVTILLSHPTTGLTRAFDIAVGAGPFDLATADFNRDGIPDLAVATADANSLSVLLGLGDGRFTRRDRALTPLLSPRGLTTADWNTDGIPDLIVTAYQSRAVQVLLGAGDGTFTAGATYIGSAVQPQGVATADFNHDGFLDVAVAYDSVSGLRILYGTGGTTFTARTIPGDAYLNVVATGDFNADGWMDVAAVSTRNNMVAIYAGSATGPVHTHTYVTGGSPRGLTAADVNGDGKLDLITANRGTSTVSVLVGDAAHPGSFLPAQELAAALGSRDVVAADFNADGLLDLATGNEYAATTTVLSNSTALAPAGYAFRSLTLPANAVLDPSGQPVRGTRFAAADFNRDGRPDFVVPAAGSAVSGRLVVVLSGMASVTLAGPAPFSGFLVDDFNADGNGDVLAYGAERATAYLGDGHHAFSALPITTGLGASVDSRECTSGDMNRDGRADLVCGDQWGGHDVSVYLGAGDGTFVAVPQDTVGCGAPAIVDMDRDGRLDVVCPNAQIFRGDGTGRLTPLAPLFGPEDGYQGWSAVRAGDLNGDGYPDLVFFDYGDGRVCVLLGGSDGYRRVDDPGIAAVEDDNEGPELADVNVDGHLDVVINAGSEDAGIVLVSLGRGDGTFEAQAFTLALGPVVVADLTGDGLPDIAAYTLDGIDVLVNTRGHVNHPPVVPDYAVTATYPCFAIGANASDPDEHALFVTWFDESGAPAGGGQGAFTFLRTCVEQPGLYRYTRTATDGRGGTTTGTLTVTVNSGKEIVLYAATPGLTVASEVATFVGNWLPVPDPTAAGGYRAYNPNLGAPKAPQPDGTNYVSIGFSPDPALTYKLWVRLKADGNSWANDSVWVRLPDGTTDAAGTPISALAVNLEECSGCGEAGWGWEDDGWGAVNKNGVLLRFPGGQFQGLSIFTREDGVSVDQIVLSAEKYRTARPGKARNDTTILPRTSGWSAWGRWY